MAITASVEPESGRIVYAGSDFPIPIRFRFFVFCFSPKKAQTLLCKTDPDLIWMALSGFSQTHRVRKQAGVQESSGLVSGRMSPISHFQTRMRSSTDGPHHLVQNHPGSDLLLADCQVLAKRIRPGSKLP